jgi:hypothetical protein
MKAIHSTFLGTFFAIFFTANFSYGQPSEMLGLLLKI